MTKPKTETTNESTAGHAGTLPYCPMTTNTQGESLSEVAQRAIHKLNRFRGRECDAGCLECEKERMQWNDSQVANSS